LGQVSSGKGLPEEVAAALREGNDGKALALIRALPDGVREQFEILAHKAHLLGKLGRHEEEAALLGRLIAGYPGVPGLHLSLANAMKTLGRRDEAISAARAALAGRPGYGKAWWTLADLKTYQFDDAEVAAMEAALADAESSADRLHLQFALGRAFEQRGQPEQAFAFYAAGNAATAAAAPPAAMRVTERVDQAIAAFTPQFFAEREGFGDPGTAPIFILGLHRAGSTVVEQILASHSEIEATSELPIIGKLMRSVALDASLPGASPLAKLQSLDADRARALGAEYLARAADYRASGKPRFIDKMPSNWLHLGFIRLILPNATIIDARRHPMAAGFSNFRQHYDMGAVWTASLESIGQYYRDYLRLMRHFDRVLPGWVHHVINEQLIDDFEPEVRRLLDHVGVEFEPACLEFHRSGRPVRSASAEQVRRPVNRDGVDQWRAFAPWLDPLQDSLGDALEDWQE
jgi:tetratricopeptide (TPR) repeat protein